jgi:hypothetical protein
MSSPPRPSATRGGRSATRFASASITLAAAPTGPRGPRGELRSRGGTKSGGHAVRRRPVVGGRTPGAPTRRPPRRRRPGRQRPRAPARQVVSRGARRSLRAAADGPTGAPRARRRGEQAADVGPRR